MIVIPRLLEVLLSQGRWPRTSAEACAQNSRPLAAPGRVRMLAPEEDHLVLAAPPFRTLREEGLDKGGFWTWPMAAPEGIDFDLAICIGDFGIGSDAPIVLDYRTSLTNPQVLRLRWAVGKPNEWVKMAPDFKTFVVLLGL